MSYETTHKQVKKMRLLHITASPFNNEGGVPVVLKELVKEQSRLPGMTVKVLSLKNRSLQGLGDQFDILNGISFEQYVRNFSPDIAILHSFFYMEYITPANILHKLNIPFYIEPHGSFGHEAMRKSYLKKVVANNTIFRNQLKYAKSYIYLNEREKTDSIYHKPNELVIPNGINKSRINFNVGNGSQHPLLYFIGRYDVHHKGIDRLFDALKYLDDQSVNLEINFYGKGPDKDHLFIQDKIQALHNIRVNDKGPITPEEQNKEFEQKGIMLLTSRFEGFPMTILEALSYGNPSVVTRGTNMAEEIDRNHIGWMVNDKPSDIANGILKAIDSYQKAPVEYIKRCKHYVMNNYTWDVIAKLSYELLKKEIFDN